MVTLQLVTGLHMYFYLHVSVSAATPTLIARPCEFPLVAPRSSVSLAVATAVMDPTIMITCARAVWAPKNIIRAQDVFFKAIHKRQ